MAVGRQGATLHYLRMEDVHGTALDHLIGVKGKLSPSRAVPLVMDIAQALKYLEKEGFVHGDLRAEHILVDPRSRGRLLDVGSARPLDSGGKDPRIAADVFALGTLLRAMLTGSLADSERAADLGSVSVSAALLAVIRNMLHPDPARRFQHFGDVVAVLQAAVEPANL
jgi:serine/threonine protein kinase